MVKRTLAAALKDYQKKFPVLTLTGARQTGKSTLLRDAFPSYAYISLEDPDIRGFAEADPRGFLRNYKAPVIIDEAQHVPELFSYIQTMVDQSREMGAYILSGSHNFLLMEGVSQSLAGRAAVLRLAPFSLSELASAKLLSDGTDDILIRGGYPAVFDRGLEPKEYFPSYVQTYLERDVRLLRNISDMSAFVRFIRLCAARSAQVINFTEIANVCGISVPSARAWMSVLEQSDIIFMLQPYYKNFSKRLVKSPKLYFYDTGLLCYLLGIEDGGQLMDYDRRGAVFETLVVSEYMKSRLFAVREPRGYFWRDSNQNEVDLLTEQADGLHAYEIKLSETMQMKHLKTLQRFADLAGLESEDLFCVYTGDHDVMTAQGSFRNFRRVFPA